MIDYSSVDFIDLLESRLGLRNVRMTAAGIEVVYSCHRPEHAHGDDSPSSYMNSEKGTFFCHGCLPASELVLTMRGYVSISEVDLEDKVLGVDGRWHMVSGHRELRGDLLNVRTGIDKLGIEMTGDHLCLRVPRQQAIDMVIGLIARPSGVSPIRLSGRKRSVSKDLRLDVCEAQHLERGDFLVTPVARDRLNLPLGFYDRPTDRGPQNVKIRNLPVDDEMAWVYGLWLAEGSLSTRGVRVDLHEDELDLAERWIEIIHRRLGPPGKISTKDGSKGIYATVNSVDLNALMSENFGTGCAGKKIPGGAFTWEQSTQRSLVDGYIDGDGDAIRRQAATVSRHLAYGIVQLCIQSGKRATLTGHEPSLVGAKSRRYCYNLQFPENDGIRCFFSKINDLMFCWTMVQDVSPSAIDQVVYDIQVDGAESFVTKTSVVHNCQFKGTAPDLVADVQQIPKPSAERFLREIYGVSFNEPVGGSMVDETEARFSDPIDEPPRIPPPESWLASVRLDWQADPLESYQQYMLDRGLSVKTLEAAEIGYDFLSDRLTIPVRDLDGRLIGAKGRDWSGRHPAKYLVLGNRENGKLHYGFDTYEITSVVFGLHRSRDHRSAILVEGELDAVALLQMGAQRPVASGRAGLSSTQVKLLVDECEEVIVYYDRGPAGEKATDQAVSALEPHLRVKIVEPLDVDPCDALRYAREDEVLQAIADARSSLLARPYSGRIFSRA